MSLTPPVFCSPLDAVATTLSASHTAGGTTLTVASAAGFGSPSAKAPVRIACVRASDSARVDYKVTNVSGTTLTIALADGYTDINLASGDALAVTVSAGTLADVHAAILALGVPAFAVSNYSPASDGVTDDFPAFAACVNACLTAGGGEVLIDVPLWFLGSGAGTWDGVARTASNLIFRGRGDATPITLGTSSNPFNLSNFNLVAWLDLVFIGKASVGSCTALSYCNVTQGIFQRCIFLNVVASAAPMIACVGGIWTMRDCKVGGCGTSVGPGLIWVAAGSKLLMDEVVCFDYGTSRGVTYSGRTNPSYPWVKYEDNEATGTQVGADPVGLHVRDSFFDEGCLHAIAAARTGGVGNKIRAVLVENTAFNGPGAAVIDVDSVQLLRVSDCSFGWNASPAVKARNVRYLVVERCDSVITAGNTIDADATVATAYLVENSNMAHAVGFAPVALIEQVAGVVAFGVSPTAPTAALNDNTTKVATTAHVRAGYASKAGTSVTGSRGGNAALASLLTALASAGLITDSTSA